MHADLKGALRQINKCYLAFEHKGKKCQRNRYVKF